MEDVSLTHDCIVIGAGISGVTTVKCMKDVGFNVVCLERSGDVGGLWAFKEKRYGVMRFTHINVSKENYAFSDYPFPDDTTEFPHNKDMAQYVQNYCKHFNVMDSIKFHVQVNHIERSGEDWLVVAEEVEEDDEGVITPTGRTQRYTAHFLAIATGHHAKAVFPNFPGQDTFTGKAIHSVDYNDADYNEITGKKVLIVGIGNSAIDIAVNAATQGKCKPVHLSTRSGAWVVPNYVFGYPVDFYACRMFLKLPWRVGTFIFESVLKLLQGNPKRWKLNPKMHALQTQPTVSPVLVHHIQREEIKIVPNIKQIAGPRVQLADDTVLEPDVIIYCTGYKIDLPFLDDETKSTFLNEKNNEIKLYKNVFSPSIGHSLAFIGFVQPASGGVLTMSEIQARWWAELCKDNVFLPSASDMEDSIVRDLEYVKSRWFHSNRHTIQRDPILYNDDIAAKFGAKPDFCKHPRLAPKLLLSSCGASQWRLQGPGKWPRAAEEVGKVPITPFLLYGIIAVFLLAAGLFYFFFTWMLDRVFDYEVEWFEFLCD